MTPMELLRLLDSRMVEELKMYYNGRKIVVNIRSLPETMPNYEIYKLWNSEDGKGISVLLIDNLEYYPIPKFVEDKTYTDKGGAEQCLDHII